MTIYHLAVGTPPGGDYEHPSLRDEGFIHCSTATQLPATVERYYADRADELVVVAVDTDRLSSEVRWEESTGGERFPHVYGPIAAAAIVGVTSWAGWRPPSDPPTDAG